MATTLPKLEVLGVNIQVFEVKEHEFDIYFNLYSLEGSNYFEQKRDKSVTTADRQLLWAVWAVFWRQFHKFKISTRDVKSYPK